jgi:hypothetical protein
MSEEDIKALNPSELKQFITECCLKGSSLKKAKKDLVASYNELLKDVEEKKELALDVLEGKDSALARKVMIEVQTNLESK